MSSEVQRRIDQLGEQLGRSVVVNDPGIRLLYTSRHYGDEDAVRIKGVLNRDPGSRTIAHVLAQGVSTWSRPGRIPPAPELGLLGRIAVPVRWHGELLGVAMIIDQDETLTAEETAQLDDFAHEVAGLLVAERHEADRKAAADEQDVAAWLSRDPVAAEAGRARLISRGLLPDLEHVRVFAVVVPEPGPAGWARTNLAVRHAFGAVRGRFRGTSLAAVRDGHGVVAVVSRLPLVDPHTEEIAESVLTEIRDVLGAGHPVRIGIGAGVEGVAAGRRSRRQADLAARAVPLLDRGDVAHWGALGVLQLLARIPTEEMDDSVVPDAVVALRASDPHGQLVETLTEYLHRGGAGSATADALHIHRTTLYYRLDRIRRITGLDIDDGDVRLHLQLGLLAERMRRRLGAAPPHP